MLQTLTNEELADRLGLSDHLESEGDSTEPSPWGVARLIRREIRRRGLATQRELRNSLEAMLVASGFDNDASGFIRNVADRMVAVGELADVRVENQRGYAALPSRWIELSKNDAVLLGTVCTEQHRFHSSHPKQFLRRFRPSDSIVTDFDRIGVKRQSFADWFGPPEWLRLVRTDETLSGLEALWSWYVSQLRARGAPLDLQHTKTLAIAPKPGTYFGRPWNLGTTRWTKPTDLPDGCYLAAQQGYHERQWHPLIIEIAGSEACSLLVGEGLSSSEAYDLHNWLLLARAESVRVREQIIVDTWSCEIALTCPAPRQLAGALDLIGEPAGIWRHSVLDVAATIELLSNELVGIEFKSH
ncbi:MAG: hypothetical protein ABI614_26545 [Planctomycetota bacterium]